MECFTVVEAGSCDERINSPIFYIGDLIEPFLQISIISVLNCEATLFMALLRFDHGGRYVMVAVMGVPNRSGS